MGMYPYKLTASPFTLNENETNPIQFGQKNCQTHSPFLYDLMMTPTAYPVFSGTLKADTFERRHRFSA